MRVNGDGPIPARIMIVGEAPVERDVEAGRPFSSTGGAELNRMLAEAGIMRSECYLTNVARERPAYNNIGEFIALKKKDITSAHFQLRDKYVTREIVDGYAALLAEIEMVKPNLIITLGNVSLWALTGLWGVAKWRGSQLMTEGGIKLIPTIHPVAILREWSNRALAVTDLRRAKRFIDEPGPWTNVPEWRFQIRPSFAAVTQQLQSLIDSLVDAPLWVDLDIETKVGHIECIGLSWSRTEALVIPLMCVSSREGYWNLEEEAAIVYLLYRLLTHKGVSVRWQNGLYDAQYIYRHWHFIPRHGQDTMISHHSAFAALPKGLGFLASMYCDYFRYWKDEGKEATNDKNDDQRWAYNGQDCIYTREVGEVLTETLDKMGLARVDAGQQALFYPVLSAMLRGVRVSPEAKGLMAMEIQDELSKREAFLYNILGHSINVSSPKQMQELFYTDLGQRPILKRTIVDGRTKMAPTCDDEALQTLSAREPLLRPITNAIADIRTLNKFLGDFVMMPLDEDGRMRCSYNIAGDAGGKSAPYSYRLSSSKNAFNSGGNLQTIPSDKSKSGGKAAARGSMDFKLPNIRSMYVPDAGYTYFDMDLDRADLQVVVWESGEEELKTAMRLGVDIHLLNVYTIDNKEPPPLEELVETHPRYPDHRGPRKHKREFAKVFAHACLTGEHEVLTQNGWVRIDEINDITAIAVWNRTNSTVTFEVPVAWNRDVTAAGESMLSLCGQAYSQVITYNHTLPYATDANGYKVSQAQFVAQKQSARLPKSGYYSGPQKLSCIKLIVAFLADGSIDTYGNVYFHFHKERKKERMRELLKGREYSEYPDRFYIPWREASDFTRFGKKYGAWLLQLCGENLDELLEELEYWDGCRGATNALNITSVDPVNTEWLRTIAHLRGHAAQDQGVTTSGFGSVCHRISINNRPDARLGSMQVKEIHTEGNVKIYCPQTSVGFFLVRHEGKISVTGNTNYGGGAKTVAAHTGRSVHEIDTAQKKWFSAHPGITRWHQDTEAQIQKRRYVENRFGYRWHIFDRLDALLPEALAWVPQSTVGIVINKAWIAFYNNLPEVQVLLQVHDSLAGQFPTHRRELLLPLMKEHSRITIPYDDPLIIPTGIKTSEISWGDCK